MKRRNERRVVCSTPRFNDELEWVATAVTTPTTLAHSCCRRCGSRCWCWDWNLHAYIAVSVRCGHHVPSGLLLCSLWPPPFLVLRSSTISCSKFSGVHRGSTSQLWLHLLARDKGILFRQVVSKQGHSQDGHGQTNAKAWKEWKSAAHLWRQNKSYKSEKSRWSHFTAVYTPPTACARQKGERGAVQSCVITGLRTYDSCMTNQLRMCQKAGQPTQCSVLLQLNVTAVLSKREKVVL